MRAAPLPSGLWAPYLAWQAGHGWPELAIARSIASGGSGTSAPRWELLPFQLVLVGYLAPVGVAGLVRLLRGDALRWCRALGIAFVVLLIIFTVTGGKPYYLGGMFPVLLGAGAQPALDWVRRGRTTVRAWLLAAAARSQARTVVRPRRTQSSAGCAPAPSRTGNIPPR